MTPLEPDKAQPTPKEQTVKWIDLVPSGWFKQPDKSSIWVAGYRVLRVPKEMLPSEPVIIDLARLRALLIYGKLIYQDASGVEIEIIDETHWKIDAEKLQQKETLEGVYLLLMSPFDRDGEPGSEAATKQRLSMYVAMFVALFGRNIVYKRIFDSIVHCATGQITSHSPVIENPFWFPAPDISAPHLKTLQATDAAMASLQENEKHRVQLSLRWFESAIFDSGVDGFLKYWIALETLAMPDTTNIRPLNQSLADAYGLGLEEARDRFAIGRLYGLRSRIVHDGLIVGIRGELLTYTQAIYVDVFQRYLGLPCERRAEQVVNSPEFKLDDYLPA